MRVSVDEDGHTAVENACKKARAYAGALHRGDDLLLGRPRTGNRPSRPGGQPAELGGAFIAVNALEEGEVLEAHERHEGLALLVDDDRLARVADPDGELREARSGLAGGGLWPPAHAATRRHPGPADWLRGMRTPVFP